MKRIGVILTTYLFLSVNSYSQNTFPSSGNVGIGTATPQTKLDVNGEISVGGGSVNANTTKIFLRNPWPSGKTWALSSGANMVTEASFSIYNWSDNQTTPFFHINVNGNIGIGSTSPSNLLHIKSTTLSPYIRFDKASTNYESGLVFGINGSSDFYFFTDNDNNSLKIEASGLDGEGDATPRMEFPKGNKNILASLSGGNFLIGKNSQTNTAYKLDVAGKIHANEIIVDSYGADFVFEPTYQLMSLQDLEAYLKANRHLPGIATATEMQENGVSAGEMQTKLLQKVEELTLYVIEQNKRDKEQTLKIQELESKIETLLNSK